MVCPPRAAVLGSRTRVDAYNRSITKPLTGEPDAGDPPVRFGGRGKVQSLVPTPIGATGAPPSMAGPRGSVRVAVGMALVPSPGGGHDVFELRVFGLPTRSEEHTSELQSLRH